MHRWREQTCIGGMSFGWGVVFFRALECGEVDVPGASPPVLILPLFGPTVCYAVGCVVSSLGPTVRVRAMQVGLARVDSASTFGEQGQ